MAIAFFGTILDAMILFMVKGLFDVPQGAINPGPLIIRAALNAVLAPLVMRFIRSERQDQGETF